MNNLLERAIDKAKQLPDAQQEKVAQRILTEIEALTPETPRAPDHWARVAKQLASHGALRGRSEEFPHEVRDLWGSTERPIVSPNPNLPPHAGRERPGRELSGIKSKCARPPWTPDQVRGDT